MNVTATGHRFGPGVRFEDVDFASGEEYDPWVAYAQAKGANVLHAVGLVKLGVVKRAVAVNPGATAGTGLYQGENGKDGAGFGEGRRLKTPEEAAGSVVFAALAEEVVDGYWEDCRAGRAAAWAEDEGNAERLWRLSEGLVDQALRK